AFLFASQARQLRCHGFNALCWSHITDDVAGLILVVDARETKGQSSALRQRLVPQHPMLHFPGFGVAATLGQVFSDLDWPGAILAPDGAGAGNQLSLLVVLPLEIEAVKLRVTVGHVGPAVDGYNWRDPASLCRESVDFPGERV